MWLKLSAITVLFYFLALAQNSFFVQFNILGAVPNFIFILFFILVFFSPSEKLYSWEILFYSFIAGFFTDIFSYSYFGSSFVIFLTTSLLIKKIFNSLRQKRGKYPIDYFVLIFIITFVVYEILSAAYYYFFSPVGIKTISWDLAFFILIKMACGLIFAVIGFLIYKSLVIRSKNPLT